MSEFMLRAPIYDGLSIRRAPDPCQCCSPPYEMPRAFYNDATLTDPVLRHHANIGVGRPLCGFGDCPICAAPAGDS